MIFPGLKKVRDKFNLRDDGVFVKGEVKNSRVKLCDGHNKKILTILAPAEISEESRAALQEFSKKPYKAKVQVDSTAVTFTFYEWIVPYSWQKICEVLEKSAKIFYEANPDLPPAQDEGFEETALEKQAVSAGRLAVRIAGIAVVLCAPFFLKEAKSFKYASDFARSVQADCPTEIDEWTTLESASSFMFKVYLNYTLYEAQDLDEDAPEIIKENFIQNIRDSGMTQTLFERTIWFVLTYRNVAGDELFQIKIVPVDYK